MASCFIGSSISGGFFETKNGTRIDDLKGKSFAVIDWKLVVIGMDGVWSVGTE